MLKKGGVVCELFVTVIVPISSFKDWALCMYRASIVSPRRVLAWPTPQMSISTEIAPTSFIAGVIGATSAVA